MSKKFQKLQSFKKLYVSQKQKSDSRKGTENNFPFNTYEEGL